MTSKLDRRKKYTRMVLKDSLIKLLSEKQISTITVKEICELADINRSTFYSHYSDHFDLLNQIEEEIIEDMNQYLSQYNFKKEEESLQMTEKLLEYIVSKRDICQTLLNENVDTTFQKRVMDVSQRFLMQSWVTNNNLDEDMSEYLSTFIISGSIHVIKSWLSHGLDKSPKQMAEIINNLTNKGLSSIK
ncbi:TetR/AcrR family transcriptional regulator [Aquibacillus halophilus]|uniref:TetR/AcrR family transcriptional regulator n=1 Tax=Aquibacillus halophilus TaxID=930132 RepID=A0A6A8D746_9BACI|nr:TetR-like C-terminal domain-containing protein [Aquibacillus halophilus]MRH41428.1 TetR/AcrR family transcriptional regulator [Aquibacillus halophilus]